MARSRVEVSADMTTGEMSGRNAFARVRRLPSVSMPRLRWASEIVFIVPVICGMIWNTELMM